MTSYSTDLIDALNFRSPDHRFGNFELVKRLLDQGSDPNTPNAFGLYPIHVAAHPLLVRLLLDTGARPDVRCSHGMTALHRTVINRQFESARILMISGVDRKIRDRHNKTARHYLRQLTRYTLSTLSAEDNRQRLLLLR